MRKVLCMAAVLLTLLSGEIISQQTNDSTRTEKVAKPKPSVVASVPIQLSGYGQVRYQIKDEPGKADGFDFRRGYVDLKGNISTKWGYRLQADFAISPKIIDVYADYKLNQYLNFTFGQFALPFSLNNITGNTKLELIDRSQAVEALVARGEDVIGNQNGRDIGLQVGGTFLKLGDNPLIEYKIGVFNGAGINVKSDNNEAKDIVTRIILTPFKDLSFGGSYYNGIAPIETSDTTIDNKGRTRLGLEASYTISQFSLKGEYIMGSDGSTDRGGYFAQASYYIIPKKFQVVAKYDYYDENTDLNDDASTWYIGGLNYFFTPNVLLQVNYTFKEEESNSYNNNLAAMQLQVNF